MIYPSIKYWHNKKAKFNTVLRVHIASTMTRWAIKNADITKPRESPHEGTPRRRRARAGVMNRAVANRALLVTDLCRFWLVTVSLFLLCSPVDGRPLCSAPSNSSSNLLRRFYLFLYPQLAIGTMLTRYLMYYCRNCWDIPGLHLWTEFVTLLHIFKQHAPSLHELILNMFKVVTSYRKLAEIKKTAWFISSHFASKICVVVWHRTAINIILHTSKMGSLLNPTGLLIIASDELAEALFLVIPVSAFYYVILSLPGSIPLLQNYNNQMLFVWVIPVYLRYVNGADKT